MEELEEILQRELESSVHPRYILGDRYFQILEAIKEIYNKGIIDASENVKILKRSCGDPMTCGCQGTCEYPISYVDKQSILKLLKP